MACFGFGAKPGRAQFIHLHQMGHVPGKTTGFRGTHFLYARGGAHHDSAVLDIEEKMIFEQAKQQGATHEYQLIEHRQTNYHR